MKLEKLDFEHYMYVTCIPVKMHKTAPPDQKNCHIEKCGNCNQDMWVSEKKDAMRNNKPDVVKLYCTMCIVRQALKQGFMQEEIEIVDILKMN